MDEKRKSTIYEKYISIIENETLGTKLYIYGFSSVGLLYAMYAIRPFAKFRRPSDVPNHFLRDYMSFRGTVAYVEPSSNHTLLMVDHQPTIPSPRWGKRTYLPVKLPGINVTSNGVCWLQSVVVGKNVSLVPISKQREFVECIVTVPEKNKEPLNIAGELLKLGFSTVSIERREPISDTHIKSYFKSLHKAQKWAKQNRNGYWFFNTTPTLMWKIQMYLRKQLGSVIPVLQTK